MSQVINQEQMDTILEAISPQFRAFQHNDSEDKKKKTRNYDFRRRSQISRENRKVLERIHDSFSTELASYLNGRLRKDIKVQLNSVYQFTIEEFYDVLHNPTCIFLISLVEQQRNIVFEIRQNFAFYIVDRILGGQGNANYQSRELTQIEQNILQHLVKGMLDSFQSVWENITSFEAKLENYFSKGDYLHFVRRGDSVVSVAFKISIDDKIHLSNVFNITYPLYLIEELIPDIQVEDEKEKNRSTEQEKRLIKKNVGSIATPIKVNLGHSHISIKELANLQKGDVVMLDQHVKDYLELQIGKSPRFLGRAGLLKNKMAFKVKRKY